MVEKARKKTETIIFEFYKPGSICVIKRKTPGWVMTPHEYSECVTLDEGSICFVIQHKHFVHVYTNGVFLHVVPDALEKIT